MLKQGTSASGKRWVKRLQCDFKQMCDGSAIAKAGLEEHGQGGVAVWHVSHVQVQIMVNNRAPFPLHRKESQVA